MANFPKKEYRNKTDYVECECWVSEEIMSFSINIENDEVSNVLDQRQMRKWKLKINWEKGVWSYHSGCDEN